MQLFWSQLCAVKQLSEVGSAKLLQLGSGACFPLEGSDIRGRLYVRQCYVDLAELLEQHLAQGGRSLIITGTPGDHCHKQMWLLLVLLCVRPGRVIL